MGKGLMIFERLTFSFLFLQFIHFLRFVFPNADRRFDMKKGFTFLDKELAELYPHPEEASETKFVDKLVQVYTRSGKEKL